MAINVTLDSGDAVEVLFEKIEFISHAAKHEAGGTDPISLNDLPVNGDIDVDGNDIVDGTLQIYDSDSGTINVDAFDNTSFTINSGNALSGGGTISLGGSLTLDVSPNEIEETELNLDIDPVWSGFHTFESGIDVNDDITDNATLIYDSSLSQIEQDVLENDSLTITSGNGLKNGGTVSLGGSTTLDVEPDDIAGFGVEDDGSDNLRVDEDAPFTWTDEQTFDGGVTVGSTVDLQNTYQISNAPSPVDGDDLARKSYVDSNVEGATDVKDSVTASPTVNIDLASATDPNPVDGVTLSDGDRVLLKEQTDGTENGIYVATTATDPTTWVRAVDADEDSEVTSGLFTFVEEGTDNGSSSFIVTTVDPITLGVTSIDFAKFSSSSDVNAGDGLTKSGQTFDINVSDFVGLFVSDDGANNIEVDIGSGLENDGGGNIQVDEDANFAFTQTIDFAGGLDTQNDVTDGAQVIWDASAGEIPDSAMGSIDNATLANQDVTVTAGDGIKGGGTIALGASKTLNIEPSDFAGAGLLDDGSDNLAIDESEPLTWTTKQTFNSGLDTQNDITDGAQVIWDSLSQEIPNSALGSIDSSSLTNDSLTITAGDGITGGGEVALGSSTTIDIEPADFAGLFLSTDGSNNLKVDIGRGLENNGSDGIRVNEDTDFTFSDAINFLGGLDTQDDITDGNQVIWDASLGEIPGSALSSNSLTLTAGDGIKGGGSVSLGGSTTFNIEPADFAGTFLSDDGNDNLIVDIGRGLENDGAGNIQFNEDTAYTFTSAQTFSAGLQTNADITDGSTLIYDSSASQIEQDTLENDTVTVAGNTVALGGSTGIAYGDLSNTGSSIPNTDLVNQSITINANDGLVGGGTIPIGGTAELDIEPADIAGTFLSDDGNDNLTVDLGFGLENDGFGQIRFNEGANLNLTGSVDVANDTFDANEVDIGRGLENDGTGAIQFDEDTAYTLTSLLTASGGVDLGNDITEGGTVIYDTNTSQIQQDVLENDSLTVTAGNGLKNGGLVALGGSTTLNIEPSQFAGDFLSDQGSDNLNVDIGTGLEDDGAGNIRVDEDFSPTWTASHTFNGGITAGAAIDLQDTYRVTNAPAPVNSNDLARKQYVDNSIEGATDIKESARASSTGNINLASATDPNPVDGVALSNGDRVLLQDQTDATENGIYDAVTATDPTTWVRSSDADEDAEVTAGLFVFVEEGTSRGNSSFIITTPDPITLGVTSINFSQFSSAGEISGGDGLTKSGQTLSVNVNDLLGTFVSNDGSNNFTVDIGAGVENDGAGNIRLDENYAATWTSKQSFNGGLDTSDDITDGATVIWDSSASEIPGTALTSDTITITAGDGLQNGGAVSLGGSTTLDVDVSNFAGTGLQDDGAENLELVSNSITVNANDGLVGGGTVTLGNTVNLDIEPADFAGSGLQDDGLDNLELINDSVTVAGNTVALGASTAIATGDLTGDTDGLTEGVSNLFYTDERAQDGVGGILGANFTYDDVGNAITLTNDSVTVTAGDGLQSGGTVALGGSTTLDVDVSQFAGSGLQDDGAENLRLTNDSITVNAGDGIQNGGTVALGGSTTLDINVSDFVGTNLSDDGSENLQLDIQSAVAFNQNEAQSLVLEQIAGDATTPVTGQIWYDTTQD